MALVIGADTAPKGFFAPTGGRRPDDPDWLRFHIQGITNPTYFGLYARRRMDLYGATPQDFAAVKVKNAKHGFNNPNARYKKEVTVEDVLGSAVVADPLHLLDICATSDGAAALVLSSMEFARKHATQPVKIAAVSTVTPVYPNTIIEMPNLATDSSASAGASGGWVQGVDRAREPTKRQGLGPENMSLAEVYDLSTALELDWYEQIGLCARPATPRSSFATAKPQIGGRVPVNPSGGLASSFGEAVPSPSDRAGL